MTDLSAGVPVQPAPEVPAAPAAAPVEPLGDTTPHAAVMAMKAEAEGSAAPAEGEKDARPFFTVRKGTDQERVFHLEADVSDYVVMRLAAASDPNVSQGEQMSSVVDFLDAVVVEDELPDFLYMLKRAKPAFKFPEIQKILEEASEAIGGRPTQP